MSAATELPVHYWSHSAVAAAAECPRQYALGFGPRRAERHDADAASDNYRRLGLVLHVAMATACEHARDELALRPLPGARLERYTRAARVALGEEWERQHMPSDPAMAQQAIDMLDRSLRAVLLPGRGCIESIEQSREITTPGGVKWRWTIDYAYWISPGVLRLVDWKSGRVHPDDVNGHDQLYRYCGLELLRLGDAVKRIEIELFSMRKGVGYHRAVEMRKARLAVRKAEETIRAVEAAEPPRPLPITPVAPATQDSPVRAASTPVEPSTAPAEAVARAEQYPAIRGPHCGGCAFRRGCPALTDDERIDS